MSSGANAGRPVRELKVEDALQYLDQVSSQILFWRQEGLYSILLLDIRRSLMIFMRLKMAVPTFFCSSLDFGLTLFFSFEIAVS